MGFCQLGRYYWEIIYDRYCKILETIVEDLEELFFLSLAKQIWIHINTFWIRNTGMNTHYTLKNHINAQNIIVLI